MNNKISMKEIAGLAGTSVATVSRVINGNGRFSKETEKRVREIIEQYDYHPNLLAKGLREDRMKVIGVIVPDVSSDFFIGIVRAMERELYPHGYMTVLCDTAESEEAESAFIGMLGNMRFSGIVYVGGKRSQTIFKDVPVLYIDRKPGSVRTETNCCFIGSDNYMGGCLAARRLLDAGRTNPAIVLFDEQFELETQIRRLHGFRSVLAEHGIILRDSMIYYVQQVDYESGVLVTERILSADPAHDAVFYTSDILAIGGIQYLNAHGVSIPDEISLIGMDDIPLSARINPPLTTIRQQYAEFGRLAAASMLRMLSGETLEDQVLPVQLVERGTV